MKTNNNIYGDSSLQDKPASGTVPSGIFYALGAACVSGISIFYNKIVIVNGIDPLSFNILKNGSVAIILTLLILRTGERQRISGFVSNKKLWLIGIIGGSIPFVLFFTGLVNVPAINANLIQKTLFIWVAILAIPFLKEKINLPAIIGYLLVVYANFFIGGLTGFKFSQYEGMIILATIFWAIENVIAKKTMTKLESTAVAWGRMFFGTIVLLFIAILSGKINLIGKIRPDQILPVFGSVFLLTLYVSSWYKALSLAPATQVAAILVLATPITNILSAIFITGNLKTAFTLNTLLIILGVLLIVLFIPKSNSNAQLLHKTEI